MDLSLEVYDRTFTTKFFHKRDAFFFYINRMPYLDNNIPSEKSYASVGSQIFCVGRTTTDLLRRVNLLLIWMKKQSIKCICINSQLKRSSGSTLRYFIILHILLMNLLRSSIYHYFDCVYLHAHFCVYIFICIYFWEYFTFAYMSHCVCVYSLCQGDIDTILVD